MEYYLCRVLEVCRLSEEQLIQIHIKERNIKRGLNPFEIQEILNLPTLKEKYGIPAENDNPQANYNQKLRTQLRKEGLIPRGEEISYSNIESLHEFDWKVRKSNDELIIDLQYRLGPTKKRNVEEFND